MGFSCVLDSSEELGSVLLKGKIISVGSKGYPMNYNLYFFF